MLSTIDNPYDPFDDFDNWYRYDVGKGYNSCAYLARIVDQLINNNSDEFDDENDPELIEKAIDEILKYDFTENYIKVAQYDTPGGPR
jgi:hypothetical protein